jgi:hypothetical protein
VSGWFFWWGGIVIRIMRATPLLTRINLRESMNLKREPPSRANHWMKLPFLAEDRNSF